jgi:hypothetical protein
MGANFKKQEQTEKKVMDINATLGILEEQLKETASKKVESKLVAV